VLLPEAAAAKLQPGRTTGNMPAQPRQQPAAPGIFQRQYVQIGAQAASCMASRPSPQPASSTRAPAADKQPACLQPHGQNDTAAPARSGHCVPAQRSAAGPADTPRQANPVAATAPPQAQTGHGQIFASPACARHKQQYGKQALQNGPACGCTAGAIKNQASSAASNCSSTWRNKPRRMRLIRPWPEWLPPGRSGRSAPDSAAA
jgi:hypothetical protein